MQVRLSKILVSSVILVTFMLFLIHTFYQSYGNVFFNGFDGEIDAVQIKYESGTDLNATNNRQQRVIFKKPVKGGRNIIFLETTCILNSTGLAKEDSKLMLNDQRACAIESAAKANPDSSIYLFYSCPLEAESLARSDNLVKRVFEYPNVHVWHQSMDSIFQGTPLEELYISGRIRTSMYPRTHGSDVLRFLMLYTFGGIYLDLDFVVIRSFEPLGPNFVGAESWDVLNSAALGLSSEGLGAQIAQECVEELRTDFRGNDWGWNGPGLVSRVMRRRCAVDKVEHMTVEACEGFRILPTTVFYPIYFEEWRLFYSEAASGVTMPRLKSATAVHLWNSMKQLDQNKTPVFFQRGSRQPVALLQEKFCPIVNEVSIEEGKVVDNSAGRAR